MISNNSLNLKCINPRTLFYSDKFWYKLWC